MFFVWKIQLEKVHLTRDLREDGIKYQGMRLPGKNDNENCDRTTRSQTTIVWFPEDTCAIFQNAKNHAKMINFHQKDFID